MDSRPQNPLHERYASREMAALFSSQNRYRTWRRIWITLAECQKDLGLSITEEQMDQLKKVADHIDFERVAEIEAQTRHDVVAHIRHFAELTEGDAGGIIHLGATSAFITDHTDLILQREAMALLRQRLLVTVSALAKFAQENAATPCLAYTHFQPAQLTTVGKRACLWMQDFVLDLREVDWRLRNFLARGPKGTTGTQASYLTLFDGDHQRVRALDENFSQKLGFSGSHRVTGQTYPRKHDSQLLATLAGIGESAHRFGTDLRLLQGVGELSEPFGASQVGSSAMAYKRNPIRAERMCGLSRRLITDSLNGPLNAATQWLERSLDDSANRRLVLADAFLAADAVLNLAGHIAGGLQVREVSVAARVDRELPFMATETILMEGVKRGGDRQELHELIRLYSLSAQESVERGETNPLLGNIAADAAFRMSFEEIQGLVSAQNFTGRSEQQVGEMVASIDPLLKEAAAFSVEAPRV